MEDVVLVDRDLAADCLAGCGSFGADSAPAALLTATGEEGDAAGAEDVLEAVAAGSADMIFTGGIEAAVGKSTVEGLPPLQAACGVGNESAGAFHDDA